MGDEVQGESGGALFADEVALEEAAAGDEVVFGDAGEERDAAFGGDESCLAAAGEDVGGQVDEFGVFAPGAQCDRDVPAGLEEDGGVGEDPRESGEESVGLWREFRDPGDGS